MLEWVWMGSVEQIPEKNPFVCYTVQSMCCSVQCLPFCLPRPPALLLLSAPACLAPCCAVAAPVLPVQVEGSPMCLDRPWGTVITLVRHSLAMMQFRVQSPVITLYLSSRPQLSKYTEIWLMTLCNFSMQMFTRACCSRSPAKQACTNRVKKPSAFHHCAHSWPHTTATSHIRNYL
jgi:hypothetical protein